MEEFKKFEEICLPDERHALMDQITGTKLTLKSLYKAIENIELIDEVPEEIVSQFNVAKNLAIYTWFSYSLDPVVQLKTYILIEHALRVKNNNNEWRLKKLIKRAIKKGWIKDSGFSHFESTDHNSTEYVENMIKVLPDLRNMAAHGSNDLYQGAVDHLQICASWINQLFKNEKNRISID